MQPLDITADERTLIHSATPFLWLNNAYQNPASAPARPQFDDIHDAQARLTRFAPVLQSLFPELESSGGLIESPLVRADRLNQHVNPVGGSLFLKTDNALPVAGSIKARGGIHEVLCFAEALALEHGLLTGLGDDYRKLATEPARKLFGRYQVCVGSTGNLGLSIGIMGSALGFNAVVHMSSDAQQWKKDRLRRRGVEVVEHDADYGAAVAAGRAESDADPSSYFVDDENSPRLFMGYAVAALRLKAQLEAANVPVDADHPLFVYLPAGVGGAPGGLCFGLKHLFGAHAHCFFAEPVQAPCMLLGMAGAPDSEPATVYDFGLDISTDADGLAVGKAARWVCDATRDLVSGVFTATDAQIYRKLLELKTFEDIEVEPSAAIGCLGPAMLDTDPGRRYLETHRLTSRLDASTHIVWLTGGSFVPPSEYQRYLDKAMALSGQDGEQQA